MNSTGASVVDSWDSSCAALQQPALSTVAPPGVSCNQHSRGAHVSPFSGFLVNTWQSASLVHRRQADERSSACSRAYLVATMTLQPQDSSALAIS